MGNKIRKKSMIQGKLLLGIDMLFCTWSPLVLKCSSLRYYPSEKDAIVYRIEVLQRLQYYG